MGLDLDDIREHAEDFATVVAADLSGVPSSRTDARWFALRRRDRCWCEAYLRAGQYLVSGDRSSWHTRSRRGTTIRL